MARLNDDDYENQVDAQFKAAMESLAPGYAAREADRKARLYSFAPHPMSHYTRERNGRLVGPGAGSILSFNLVWLSIPVWCDDYADPSVAHPNLIEDAQGDSFHDVYMKLLDHRPEEALIMEEMMWDGAVAFVNRMRAWEDAKELPMYVTYGEAWFDQMAEQAKLAVTQPTKVPRKSKVLSRDGNVVQATFGRNITQFQAQTSSRLDNIEQELSNLRKLISDNSQKNGQTAEIISTQAPLLERPTQQNFASWISEQSSVALSDLRARLLPLDLLPNAVIDEINEIALNQVGEVALSEDGDTVYVRRAVLAQAIKAWGVE